MAVNVTKITLKIKLQDIFRILLENSKQSSVNSSLIQAILEAQKVVDKSKMDNITNGGAKGCTFMYVHKIRI